MIARLLGILVLFTLLSSPALGDHLRGMAALLDGDRATALKAIPGAMLMYGIVWLGFWPRQRRAPKLIAIGRSRLQRRNHV